MADLAPTTPVIVGVGFQQVKSEDPTACPEATELMAAAARRAADDAGAPALLAEIESVAVLQGLWQYRNPGKLVAAAVGCPTARSILAHLGVLQLTPFDDLCRAIAAGEQAVGLVTGGEVKYRDLRSAVTGQRVTTTEESDDVPLPDVHHRSPDPFCADLEAERGLRSPIALFAMIESALRHQQRLGVDAHRDALARLYSDFSRVAAANPHAWSREPVPAAAIRDAGPRNAMQAFPYTKRHCSNWNVNRAVAILVCSARRAAALGVPRARWIFPVAAAESRHVVVLAQQRRLHSHPGTVRAGRRALALAGLSPGDLTAAELYSCFPAAVGSFAHDLRLPPECPVTVTGGMPFAGGPFNHFALEGVGRMVEVLRDAAVGDASARRVGLVANLSGIFGKQACVLLASRPSPGGYAYEDVTAAVAAEDPPVPLDAAYVGPATVVGCTVVFERGEVSHGVVICDTPGGARTVAQSDDRPLLDRMMRTEFCGRVVAVAADGTFAASTGAGDAAPARRPLPSGR